jgi:hypothetical protein
MAAAGLLLLITECALPALHMTAGPAKGCDTCLSCLKPPNLFHTAALCLAAVTRLDTIDPVRQAAECTLPGSAWAGVTPVAKQLELARPHVSDVCRHEVMQ